MFSGTYNNSIDDKGRVIIPAKYREALGGTCVLTRGLDGCLFLFPPEAWNAFVSKVKAAPVSSREARKFSRFFFSNAVECTPDKQGRMIIPQQLRDFAKIDKELVTIGVDSRVEIWSKESWDAYNDDDDLDAEMEAKMEAWGI